MTCPVRGDHSQQSPILPVNSRSQRSAVSVCDIGTTVAFLVNSTLWLSRGKASGEARVRVPRAALAQMILRDSQTSEIVFSERKSAHMKALYTGLMVAALVVIIGRNTNTTLSPRF